MNGDEFHHLDNRFCLDRSSDYPINSNEDEDELAIRSERMDDATYMRARRVIYDILWYEVCMLRGHTLGTENAYRSLEASLDELKESFDKKKYATEDRFRRRLDSGPNGATGDSHNRTIVTVTDLSKDNNATKQECKISRGNSFRKPNRWSDTIKSWTKKGRRPEESSPRPSAEQNGRERPLSYPPVTSDKADKLASRGSMNGLC
jgi:hypothetical protein